MRSFCALFLVTLSLLVSQRSFAEYTTYEERYKLAQLTAYDTVLDMCLPNGRTSIMVFVGAGANHSLTMFEEIDKADEVTPEVAGIIESPDYDRALQVCFGNDQSAKNRFTGLLLAAAGAGSFGVIYGAGKAAQGINAGLSSFGGWISKTVWAAHNARLAAAAVGSIKAIQIAINVVPMVPVATMATELWVLQICAKVDTCWKYYSKIKVNGELKKLQELGINPLAQFEFEIMKRLQKQIIEIEMFRLKLESQGNLTAETEKILQDRIDIRKQRIHDLSKSSGYSLEKHGKN